MLDGRCKMVEHKVGELVRQDAMTYMCVPTQQTEQEDNSPAYAALVCVGCALRKKDCSDYICGKSARSDKRRVHYETVYEPVDGMLFRASNGKLYRCTLKDGQDTKHDCACYVDCHDCAYIESEAFGLPGNNPLLHWVPVEEPSMIEENLAKLCAQPSEDPQERFVRSLKVTRTPWPSDGDFFYYISGKGNIRSKQYAEGSADEKFRKFNNFFETAEEAAVVLEWVKKALNEVKKNAE